MRLGITPESLIIFGAGGHAKTVIAVLEREGKWRLAGLLEDGVAIPGRKVLGYEVLGNRDALSRLKESGIGNALVAVGDNAARSAIAEHLRALGFSLASVMHPSACIMKDASIGEGSFVHALSLIGPECRVGTNAIVQPHTTLGHECCIGNGVQFAPGVQIGGRVRIGDLSFFGPGAVVFPSVNVGRNVKVGANTVVHKDIPDNTVIVGNPGRVVRQESADKPT
jgi:sugar O-acyltransferase (sialic acid O-acetyltransferase NeuD family)